MTKKKTEQFVREPFKPVEEAAFIEVPHEELVKRARDIISQVRAKPRDIAWSWALLSSLERDEPFGMDEKSYRAIYDLRDWVLKQSFQSFDVNGAPAASIKGVTTCKPEDIEDRMMVRLSDVKANAEAQELHWPDLESVAATSILQAPRPPAETGISLPYLRLDEWPLSAPRGIEPLSVEQLKRRLKDAPDYILDALVERGSQGKRASTWNPAKLMDILIKRSEMIEKQAENTIAKLFPDYLDEFKRRREEEKDFSNK